MSEPDTQDDGTTISGDEGLQTLADQAKQDEQERHQELTQAERQKRKIMRERGAVDADAPPISIEVDGYEFAFSPLPKTVRVWAEDCMFEFLGFNETELEDHPERADDLRRVKDKTVEICADHSRAAAYDAEFWADFFTVEERMGIISEAVETQDQRAGN